MKKKTILSFLVLTFFLMGFKNSNKKLFLALGDGYTAGESLKNEGNWPNLFSAKIKAKEDFDLETKLIAKKGWKIENLIKALENADKKKYDIVSVQIGINDYNSSSELKKFKLKFDNLIKLVIPISKRGVGGIFILAIPDYSCTPKGQSNYKQIHKEITALNLVIKELCDQKNIRFININEVYLKTKNDPSFLAPNQIHPSKKMYELWAELIYNQLSESSLIH